MSNVDSMATSSPAQTCPTHTHVSFLMIQCFPFALFVPALVLVPCIPHALQICDFRIPVIVTPQLCTCSIPLSHTWQAYPVLPGTGRELEIRLRLESLVFQNNVHTMCDISPPILFHPQSWGSGYTKCPFRNSIPLSSAVNVCSFSRFNKKSHSQEIIRERGLTCSCCSRYKKKEGTHTLSNMIAST